jgi:serine/threonine-protein kinase
MSPEQAQAFPDVDARTDIYSVGAILYECLTGQPPHRGQSYEQVIVHICTKEPEDVRALNPAVSEPLAGVITRALSREREDRHESARALLDALVEHAPAEVQSRFPAGSSGMKRVSVGSATGRAKPSGPGSTLVTPTGEDSGPSGPPAPGALADTVRADSGMMSVAAPPSEQPALPLDGGRRRLTVGVIVAAALVVVVGAFLLSSLGEPESAVVDDGAGGAQPAVAADDATVAPEPSSSEPTAELGAGGAAAGEDAGAPTEPSAPAPITGQHRPRPPRPQPQPPAAKTAATAATSAPLPAVTGEKKEPSGLEILTK